MKQDVEKLSAEQLGELAASRGISLVPLLFAFRREGPNQYQGQGQEDFDSDGYRVEEAFGYLTDATDFPDFRFIDRGAAEELGFSKMGPNARAAIIACADAAAVEQLERWKKTTGEELLVIEENRFPEGYRPLEEDDYPKLTAWLARKGQVISEAGDISNALSALSYGAARLIENPITGEAIAELLELLDNCTGDVATAIMLASNTPAARRKRGLGEIKFLVPGLIPKIAPVLFPGRQKSGKSTLLLELAVTVGRGGGNWCGFEIDPSACEGVPIFLTGEDPDPVLSDRMHKLDPGSKANIHAISVAGRGRVNLEEQLRDFRSIKTPLLVIDPSRSFHKGQESDSGDVSEFFNIAAGFATEKECALIITHHLKRYAKPRRLADILDALRGSEVFLDRPRVMVGLLRRDNESLMGVCTLDGIPMCNLPERLMDYRERRLRFDPSTQRHSLIEGKGNGAADVEDGVLEIDEADQGRILEAITRLTQEGEHVTKTGKYGLFKHEPRELEGLSRDRIAFLLDDLLEEGLIVRDEETGALSAG